MINFQNTSEIRAEVENHWSSEKRSKLENEGKVSWDVTFLVEIY